MPNLQVTHEDAALTTSPTDAFTTRFRRVLAHVAAHPSDDLSVQRLSGIAAFSLHHFHRQFSALFGIGVYKYVSLVRLERAAWRLAFRDHRVIYIALDSGYESHEAFSRAFKKAVGQTPSEFRQRPEWTAWQATHQPLSELRSLHMQPDHHLGSVKTIHFDETRVAALEHRGDPDQIGDSIRRFIEWRKQNRLPPKLSATFNIIYGSPETPPEDLRMDLCAATTRPILPNDFGVVEKLIPAGRCAVLRHHGSDDTLPATVHYLYATWLPASGEDPRDFPLYFQRVSFFPDVPENEAVTDVFLPLR